MAMTVEEMRAKISEVYESDRWRLRVRLMPDNQVIAIYRTMRDRGQFIRKKKPKKSKVLFQQISMFD
jgi:hypothetical protein